MRLATFNILHGRSPDDGQVNLDRFGEAIRSLDADILALQEVDRDQPRSHLADLTAVAADAMGAVAHRFAAAISGTPGATWLAATGQELTGTASYGVALLSRYPAESWQVVRLPRIPIKFPMYLRHARKLIVVNEEPRAAVVGRIQTPHGPWTIAGTHLSFVPGWNRRQLQRLCRDLAAFADPVLLMGDLNMTSPGPEKISGYRSLAAHPTFPVHSPTQQLDHMLFRGGSLTITDTAAPAMPLSDHRALLVDVD